MMFVRVDDRDVARSPVNGSATKQNLKTGDLVGHHCYGSWQAVYGLFRRWQRAGIWQQIVIALQALADAAG
jgi:hypothetical protein